MPPEVIRKLFSGHGKRMSVVRCLEMPCAPTKKGPDERLMRETKRRIDPSDKVMKPASLCSTEMKKAAKKAASVCSMERWRK